MVNQKLTDRSSLETSSASSLIHVVDNGTSYNQTKANFLKDVKGYAGDIDVSAIWTSGLSFDVTADSYIVNNTQYSSTSGTVTLDTADATLDRIDLIVAVAPVSPATVGTVGKISGTPASPTVVVPPDYASDSVYVIKQVLVKAAQTEPFGTSKTVVFDEGAEWTVTYPTGFSLVSSGAYNGTNCIFGDNVSVDEKITFTSGSPYTYNDVDLITFYIKSTNPSYWNGTNNLSIRFLNSGTLFKSVSYNDQNGTYNEWNKVSISKDLLGLKDGTFNQIQIVPSVGLTYSFLLDIIEIHQGSGSEPNNLISQWYNDVGYITGQQAKPVAYISTAGSDATGEWGNKDAPYLTDAGAYADIPSGTSVVEFIFLDDNQTYTITTITDTRAIRFISEGTLQTWDISAYDDTASGVLESVYFDNPRGTIVHAGTTAYNAWGCSAGNLPMYFRCETFNLSSYLIFQTTSIADQIIVDNWNHTAGGGTPFTEEAYIRIGVMKTVGATITAGQTKNIDIEIDTFDFTGGGASIGFSITAGYKLKKFPIKRFLGTGIVSTANCGTVDMSQISAPNTITFRGSSSSVFTGVKGDENLAKIDLASADGTTFNGYVGDIEPFAGSPTYAIGFSIYNSKITLPNGYLISSNAGLAWLKVTINIGNSSFIQGADSALFVNYNAATDVDIVISGNVTSTYGKLGDNGANIVRIDEAPNFISRQGTRLTNATVTGTYAIDHAIANDFKLTMTGNTTFSDINLPTDTITKEFTIKLTSNTGVEVPTFPAYWDVLGDAYDGSVWNFIAVQIHDGESGTEEATVFITNM